MASIYNNYMVDKNGNLVDRRNVYGEEGSEIKTEKTPIQRFSESGYIRNTFPQNLKSDGNKTYIRFEVIDEKPVMLGDLGGLVKPMLTEIVDLADDFSEAVQNTNGLGLFVNLGLSFADRAAELKESKTTQDRDIMLPVKGDQYVEIYMPEGIVYGGSVQYKGVDLGRAGALGVSALQTGKNPLTAMLNSGVTTLARGLKGAANSASTNLAVNQILQNFSSDDFDTTIVKKVANVASQVTVNPNTRQTFEHVDTRSFSFSFTMIPTSKNESMAIKDIVKFFRTQLYPESIDEAGISMGYKYPERFYIHMMYEGKRVFHKIKPAYLTAAEVKYNGGKQVFFNEGDEVEPYQTELTLSFTESTQLVRQDIKGDPESTDPRGF